MEDTIFSAQAIIRRVRSPENKYLVANLSLLAFTVQVIVSLINRYLLKQSEIASLLLAEIGAIAFFGILGLAGLVVVIRKELPQIVVVRGKFAIINGLIWCVTAWLLMFRYVYFLVVDIIKLISLGSQ